MSEAWRELTKALMEKGMVKFEDVLSLNSDTLENIQNYAHKLGRDLEDMIEEIERLMS